MKIIFGFLYGAGFVGSLWIGFSGIPQMFIVTGLFASVAVG